jgi:AraC-like DNA-binding protein
MPGLRRHSSRLTLVQKDLPLPGMVMLGRYQNVASSSALRPHQHRGKLEICFLERGLQTYRVRGMLYRMRGNDQFFTLPNEVHDTANLPQERGILYWLILRIRQRGPFLGLAPDAAARMKRELLRMPRRHFHAHRDCARILGEIVELVGQPKRSFPSRQLLRFQALLLEYLTLTIVASHQGQASAASLVIQRVLSYVEAHLSEPVHVARLAEIARLSESRFKARFKRETGVPPAEYWLRRKVERAALLLKSQSVTFVAHGLGFSSSQYFATVFKRYTLLNPSSFHHTAGN